MKLPIIAYGDPVLRKVGENITPDYPNLSQLIEDMRETMYYARGVGLAAHQIGKAIRLFLVDTAPFADDDELDQKERDFLENFNRVFINAEIIEESGEEWAFNEGCLSFPDVRQDVFRKDTIIIKYQNENFEEITETLTGLAARVVQHEYDHIEGIVFTDRISSLKKRLLKKRLNNISKGNIDVDYKMRFPNQKRK
ncbi:MAG: peptide deformylase [Flavobacteriales bacterium]|jgi:peptide deformylase|nr:peptide deformylase [Flavobacteriales bacterium]